MSRRIAVQLLALALVVPLWAVSPSELIKGIDDQLLTGYTKPLVNGFSAGMGSGLFHTAKAHKLLGFDVGVNFMYFQVPSSDKTFSDSVRCCSLNLANPGQLDTFRIWKPDLPTIFGKVGAESIAAPGHAVAIPPVWPGGLNLPGTIFLMPQVNLGLIAGLEVSLRGLPWTFRSDRFAFYGAGLSWEPTSLLKKSPVNVAVQGAFQQLLLGDALRSSTVNLNVHASAKLAFLTLYGGAAYENTAVKLNYTFNYKLPAYDVEHGFYTVDGHKDVNVSATTDDHLRYLAGVMVELPLVMIYADGNLIGKYTGVNAGIGIHLR